MFPSPITRLDEDLAALDSHYVAYQVKEKSGTLRFYADRSDDEQRLAWVCERCSSSARFCLTSRAEQLWDTTVCLACIGDLAVTTGRRYTPLALQPHHGGNHGL